MTASAPPRSEVALRFLVEPGEAGVGGFVSAGKILEWVDRAGYACAVAYSGSYSVTAYVGNARPGRPIREGQLVEVTARVVHTGSTSMHILVTVEAADTVDQQFVRALECLTVFVAIDEQRRPIPAPVWTPRTDAERELQAAAVERAERRRTIEALMAEQDYTDAGTAPETVLRFLARPADVNWGGKVHGGAVMRWIDEAAQVCATSWSGLPSAAAYASGVRFYRPIQIGDLVELSARLLHTGGTSMHVSVHVRAGSIASGEVELTTHCLMVMVALDADGSPARVPAWQPSSDEDARLSEHAQHLIRLRGELGQPFDAERGAVESAPAAAAYDGSGSDHETRNTSA